MVPLKKIKGRYEIKSVLGEGGMGVVYRAYDPPPMNRDVALKTLLEFPDAMSLQLFYKEVEVLKAMSHPNIVEIFDIGEFEDGGTQKPFFVMPLLPGNALDALIRNSSHRLTVERVIDIITQTCRGLQAAHERGLVHRDLKPSNLFVMEDDAVKIIDFGVAHTADAQSRSTGFQKGTLLYMAPEQIQYKPVSPQSDIFSLAVVCYEALTRRQPFRGTTEEEIVNAILKSIPPPASEINPAVSPTVSRVVHKAMAKQPWNRFDSAREFGETLQKALRNEPIELFDPARIQPRIQRATKALESGDYQFAGEIVGELEAEGNIDPQLTLLRTQIDQAVHQRTIAQLLESARARFEEEEDPLALQKIQEILQLDPNNAAALGLKSKIDDRRSERQIEKWLKLARQHIDNHAYSHAREALQNALQLRPNEPRAARFLAEVQAEEKEYMRVRQQKSQTYQAALNSWKNGEVSEALTQMGLVLQLDRQAPDSTSPETSSTYQNFYNKVRSEHDAINNEYAKAQRALAEQDYAKALQICEEFLAKYPNQALFQALQFDVEEQRRQQLSAFIAEVDGRLDSERDLDAKISLLREALEKYPGEGHFERSLRLASDKRDLVNSILARARAHEERGQISEAIGDMEILRTIYSPYPGLQFEIERLQKRREQQSRDSAKARWVEQVDRQLETGNCSGALELLQKARSEFPNDAELIELEKQATQGLERANQAEQLLKQGHELCQQEKFDEGLETLRQAQRLDERNPAIRSALRDRLVERAQALLETDWPKAEMLAAQALEIDPNHTLARSIRSQTQDRKREEVVAECASRARRLQAVGDLEGATGEIKKGLATYPSDQRLVAIRESLNKELMHAQKTHSRMRDLEEVKTLQQQLGTANSEDLPTICERSWGYARQHPEDPELQSIAREIERVVRERGGAPPTPKPVKLGGASPKQKKAKRSESGGATWWAQAESRLRHRGFQLAAGGVVVVLLILLGWRLRRHPVPHPPQVPTVAIEVRTSPPGATVRVNGERRGTSDLHLDLPAGDYQLETELPGFETAKSTFSAKLGSPAMLEITLHPFPEPMRIATPDLEKGQVWLDGSQVGSLESGAFTLPNLSSGPHVLRIVAAQGKQDATVQFQTTQSTMLVVDSSLQVHQLQLVVVSNAAGMAQVKSTLTGLPVVVDGKASGVIATHGLQITGLNPGVHEFVIGEGNLTRKMSFEVGEGPALDTVVFSDRDVGSMLIQVGEDGAEVVLDGKPYPRKTQRGQLRIPNLQTTQHTIRVRKEGFQEPTEQSAAIVKGQESRLRFTLEPLPKPATLVLDRIPLGAQIALDDTSIGTVKADGGLTHANITPGAHSLILSVPGYQTKRLELRFSDGKTVHLSGTDLDLKRAQGVLDISAAANAVFTIQQGGHILHQLTGSQRISVDEGVYTIVVRGANQAQPPVSLTVTAGEVRSVHLRALGSGMERWGNASEWVEKNGWQVHRGGGIFLYDSPPGPGTFLFTVKLHFSHPLFSHVSRIRWVVGYVDKANYTEMQLDNKFVYRVDMVGGNKHDFPKKTHKIPEDASTVTLRIDVSANGVMQSYTLNRKGDEWETLDSWDHGKTLTGEPRNFTAGKFGFDVPPERDIEIVNFQFTPGSDRR
jgi:serine/threonine protein kinase